MTQTRKPFMTTYQMVTTAVLAAVSAVLFLTLEIPIFGNIYKLDFSNIPVLLAGFSMGPVPALICLLLKDLIHLAIKGFGSTAGIGDLADFIMTAAMVLPATIIYAKQKSRKGALIGMLTGTVVMVVAALAVNAFIMFPFYMSAFHMDLPKIAGMLGQNADSGMLSILLATTLPFNLLKGVVLSVLTFVIYKPLSPILHGRLKSKASAAIEKEQ